MPKTKKPNKGPKRGKMKGRPAGPTMADKADRYVLYEHSVQCPEAEIDFVDEAFESLRGRKAARIREDFCGTGVVCCEWAKRRETNTATGLDLDPVPLDWGKVNHLAKLDGAAQSRVDLRIQDVRTATVEPGQGYDVILAMNFSYWCFHTRKELIEYFKQVRSCLGEDGVFFLDFYGGSEAFEEQEEEKEVELSDESLPKREREFTYVWDQDKLNPITGRLRCKIHFEFSDGSKMRDAFTYEWRLWTLPEIRDILTDAGFSKSVVYWEGEDEDGEGNGEFTASEEGEACPAWIVYVAALP